MSCLLKFKSWISGCKVTVVMDHKSLESWYKEDLCTMAGPLGRRGRPHEFLSSHVSDFLTVFFYHQLVPQMPCFLNFH